MNEQKEIYASIEIGDHEVRLVPVNSMKRDFIYCVLNDVSCKVLSISLS